MATNPDPRGEHCCDFVKSIPRVRVRRKRSLARRASRVLLGASPRLALTSEACQRRAGCLPNARIAETDTSTAAVLTQRAHADGSRLAAETGGAAKAAGTSPALVARLGAPDARSKLPHANTKDDLMLARWCAGGAYDLPK